jgi:DNA polymerase III sliding clamp (beta) subunit (PCNA family)
MTIKREHLVKVLSAAMIGTSRKEGIEQDNAFVFHKAHLTTFNGEILVRAENPLNFDAVILADDFLRLLEKFPDEDLEITRTKSEIVILGKRRSAGITFLKEFLSDTKSVPAPDNWKVLNENVPEMLQQAARTCGQDETQPLTTCVHVTPERIEACDGYRLFRVELPTGLKEVCIPAASIGLLNGMKLTKASVDKEWAHFRTEDGIEISMRCYHTKYRDLDDVLKVEGEKVKLPKNLTEMLERADAMNPGGYDALIKVSIEDGLLKIRAERVSIGWYQETRKVEYTGKALVFSVNPTFLAEVLTKTRTVIVSERKMKLEIEGIQFVVCLESSVPKKVKKDTKEDA